MWTIPAAIRPDNSTTANTSHRHNNSHRSTIDPWCIRPRTTSNHCNKPTSSPSNLSNTSNNINNINNHRTCLRST